MRNIENQLTESSKNREESAEIMELKKEAVNRVGKIFDSFPTGRGRIEDALNALKPFLDKNDFIDGEKIKRELDDCVGIKERDAFIVKVIQALQPIIRLKTENPENFESVQRKIFVEKGNFTQLSEVLSYGVYEGIAHIHLAPAKTLGIHKLIQDMERGLEELAKIIKKTPDIQTIEATSWIVAKNPKIIERFGFKVEGLIDEQTREQYFRDEEDMPISRAFMDREEFLKKYLGEKEKKEIQ